jgi:hypothetical protein
MNITTIDIDLARSVFQVNGVGKSGKVNVQIPSNVRISSALSGQ